jgi:crotonobetainyl-CoA:carnitine CoA-transferase CaiB-like acyl-CoA transferase
LVPIEHARLGVFGHVRSPMSFSADVIAPFRPPNMGEHSQLIAQQLSRLDGSRIDALTAAGVFK